MYHFRLPCLVAISFFPAYDSVDSPLKMLPFRSDHCNEKFHVNLHQYEAALCFIYTEEESFFFDSTGLSSLNNSLRVISATF
jgi:hypothetical protein